MKAPLRSGVGREIQERCGESSATMTTWIDHIADPVSCNTDAPLDPESLALSAKFQCSAWSVLYISPIRMPRADFDRS